MKWLKKNWFALLLVMIMIVGVGLLTYPTLSNYWNSFHQSRAIASYNNVVENTDEQDFEAMLEAARQYNVKVQEYGMLWKMSEEEKKEYDSLLDVTGTGMIGYVEIEKIHCSMPIYHGTDEGVLQIAAGHLEGSSLPIGGPGTHSVLSGHRGLPSAKLFTDIDQLVEGDTFIIRVLKEVLTYEVDQISVVLPEDVSKLELEEGQDYCTLITCTPYGINTHRLLVRGHRVENTKEAMEADVVPNAFEIDWKIVAAILAVVVLILMILGVVILGRIRDQKKHRNRRRKKKK